MTDAQYVDELLTDLPETYKTRARELLAKLGKVTPLDGLRLRTRALDVARTLWSIRRYEQDTARARIQQFLDQARARACPGHNWGPWETVADGLRRRRCQRCTVAHDSDQPEPGKRVTA